MKKVVLFFFFGTFILALLTANKSRSNFAFAYDASCDEPGENCCPSIGYQPRCAPTLECNSSTNKCVTKSCGNERLQCCPSYAGSPPCNTPDLECNSGTNRCQSKSCGNPGQQCCHGGYQSLCNTTDLECNSSDRCELKSCGNQGQQCCSGGYQSQCNSPTLKCERGTCIINTGSSGSAGTTIPVYDPGCTPGSTDTVKTALGCLPTDPKAFVNKAVPWAIYLGAGIAFLLGVFGALMIVLSAGNPEKMQAGKEMITSAIGGLILIVFAVFILRVVGVDILRIFDWQRGGNRR